MKIIQRYFLKEFLLNLLSALLVFTFVMMVGNLVRIIDMIIRKGVNPFDITKLIIFMLPSLLTYTIPVAVLAALLLAMGRVSSDNEVLALKTSGVNILGVVSPLVVMGAILSLILFLFNCRLVPYLHYLTRKTTLQIGSQNPTAVLEPGMFISSFEKYIVFVYRIQENKLYDIRIYEPQGKDKPPRTILAKEGEFITIPEKKIIKLKLINGSIDEYDPQHPDQFYKLNFKTYFMTLDIPQTDKFSERKEKKTKDMTMEELKSQITLLRQQGINPLPIITQMQERLTLAVSPLVFIFLGLGLAMITHRREKTVNLGLALLVAGLYYILLTAAEAISMGGVLPPEFAMWLPNLIMGSIGIITTYRACVS